MNRKTILLVFLALALKMNAQVVTDADGNTYNTVAIGTQVWLKENLKTTKYNDKSSIPLVEDATSWKKLETPAYCWYNNDSSSYKATYGALYNWQVINTNKICPTGWHVPSNEEWTVLVNYLGGDSVAGDKLKEKGNNHWVFGNKSATNSSEFTALPGGYRSDLNGNFTNLNDYGTWWSNSTFQNDYIIVWSLFGIEEYVSWEYHSKAIGHYVRCLKDTVTTAITSGIFTDISVYPNPASDRLYIKQPLNTKSAVEMCDMQGKLVFNKLLEDNFIDISELQTGVYMVKFATSGNILYRKIVKK
jgi:uncharacterized protein (TIGR02145 family)